MQQYFKGRIWMYDVSLLIKANSRIQKRRPILQDGHFIFVSDEPFFDEYALAEFMAFCNRIVHGGYPKGIPVIVQFTKEIKFEEKLMFILLECVCKYLISEGHPVSLNQIHMATLIDSRKSSLKICLDVTTEAFFRMTQRGTISASLWVTLQASNALEIFGTKIEIW